MPKCSTIFCKKSGLPKLFLPRMSSTRSRPCDAIEKCEGRGERGQSAKATERGRGREITTHVKALQVEELGNLGLHGRIAPSTARGGRGGGNDLVTLRPAYRSIVTHQRLYLSLRLLFW